MMLSDCHEPSDAGMQAKFSYEGDSKNLEQVPHSQSSSLKRDRSMEALNREYRKKTCTQTALQVWGAERAQGLESLDHGIGFQTCDHAPEYIDEEIVTILKTALNPEEDPNCNELKYEPNYQDPEIAIHGKRTYPIQLAEDSDLTSGIFEGNNSQPQDCFLVGNSYSVAHSSLANETAPNTVKTVTDRTCPSTSNYTYTECNRSSTETISQSTTEVECSTDNNFYLMSKPPLTSPDQDIIVSDFSEILPTYKIGALSSDLGNVNLSSFKSSETDSVLVKFEPPTSSKANVYGQDLNSFDELYPPTVACETVPNTVETITDSFRLSTSNYTNVQHNQSSMDSISQSRREVVSSTDNSVYLMDKHSRSGSDEESMVSDVFNILASGHSFPDFETGYVDPNTGGVYGPDISSHKEPNTKLFPNHSPDDRSDYDSTNDQVVQVNIDPGEMPKEFPESGGFSIPTTVNDFLNDDGIDESNSFKQVKGSKKLRKKANSVNGKSATHNYKQKSILTFLLDSLHDERCNPSCIKWTDQDSGQFEIVNGPELAKRRSDGRNRKQLSYKDLTRSIRYNYRKGYLSKVPKKNTYQFGEDSNFRQYSPYSTDAKGRLDPY